MLAFHGAWMIETLRDVGPSVKRKEAHCSWRGRRTASLAQDDTDADLHDGHYQGKIDAGDSVSIDSDNGGDGGGGNGRCRSSSGSGSGSSSSVAAAAVVAVAAMAVP